MRKIPIFCKELVRHIYTLLLCLNKKYVLYHYTECVRDLDITIMIIFKSLIEAAAAVAKNCLKTKIKPPRPHNQIKLVSIPDSHCGCHMAIHSLTPLAMVTFDGVVRNITQNVTYYLNRF